ncbi:MAG TPA: hypothetical protein VG899_04010 [Mycobacteriales bacterium]|nr:hypothetical protein [Mycobacteriales bacterium]
MSAVVGIAVATTVTAAVRGTWSPCGASMLSTLTPFGERARGHRYWSTAAWFVVGGILGGTCLGLAGVTLSLLARWAEMGTTTVMTVCAISAVVTLSSDLRLVRLRLPSHPRQVDENWVNRFRPWVYATGFGWQIGTGFATYVMSAITYLMVVAAALTARPLIAWGLGVGFGAIRGLSLLTGSRQHNPAAARRFHARFEALRPVSWRVAVGVQVAVFGIASATVGSPAVRAALVAVGALTAARWLQRSSTSLAASWRSQRRARGYPKSTIRQGSTSMPVTSARNSLPS